MANEESSRPPADPIVYRVLGAVGATCLAIAIMLVLSANGVDVPAWASVLGTAGLVMVLNR